MTKPKFKRGDTVRLKADPTDSWLVLKDRYAGYGFWRYLIGNVHGHEREVREEEIEK